MFQTNKSFLSRLRALPAWLRILLALSPLFVCAPLICLAVFVASQVAQPSAATATAAWQETQYAVATAERLERQQHAAETATAALNSQKAADDATATALAVRGRQALTQAALVLTQAAFPTATYTLSPTVVPGSPLPSITPTLPDFVTLTLIECRGYEGTVVFSQTEPRSLGAFKSVSITVPPGKHNLQIFWLNHPEDNVATQLDLKKNTVMVFGGQCP